MPAPRARTRRSGRRARASSVLSGMTSAGTSVGSTVKRTVHVPFLGVSGTGSVTEPSGGTAIRATGRPPTAGEHVRQTTRRRASGRSAAARGARRPCSAAGATSRRGPTRCRPGRARRPSSATRAARAGARASSRASSRASATPSGVTEPSSSAYGSVDGAAVGRAHDPVPVDAHRLLAEPAGCRRGGVEDRADAPVEELVLVDREAVGAAGPEHRHVAVGTARRSSRGRRRGSPGRALPRRSAARRAAPTRRGARARRRAPSRTSGTATARRGGHERDERRQRERGDEHA